MTNPKYPGKSNRKVEKGSPGFKVTRLPEAKNTRPYRGGGGKPPKKRGLCVQIAPQAAVPALLMLGHAIAQSLT